jgi:phosphate-selective porin OprO/OprP
MFRFGGSYFTGGKDLKLKLAGVLAGSFVVLFWATVCSAQSQTQASVDKQKAAFDKAWKFADWYKNDKNPVIQRLQFTGRFQFDYANVDADQGSHHEWNIRRFRAGAKAKMFRSITLHAEVDINPQEHNPFYVRFTDLYLMWSKSPKLELTFGKQGVPFTMDGSTSSKELLTIDRSNLANNMWFPQEYIPGVAASGTLKKWVYRAGVYSAGRANREFGEFDGGLFTLASAGYNFAESVGMDEALVSANYVYQDPHVNNTFTRRLQHVVSGNLKLAAKKWGLRADLTTASGSHGQSDLWGVMTMPFVNITPKFQIVGRHTYLKSEKPNGVLLANYENRAVFGRGDRYNEGYAGANYYFYGHKLKLQSGLQFGDMNDSANDGGAFSGVSWTTGLRVSW